MSVVQTLLCISASFFVALQAGLRGGSVYPFKCSWRFVFFIHLRMAASAGFHISLDPDTLLVHLVTTKMQQFSLLVDNLATTNVEVIKNYTEAIVVM